MSRRVLVTGLATAALLALSAAPAFAHVTVNSPGATQGGFTVLSFRVPTESDTASTTSLKVQFPTDQPIASVSVRPKAGWTYKVTKAKLATPIKTDDGEITESVSVIEWTATAGGIKPGEFDTFDVSAGPLPKVDSVTFKAIQGYSNREEVAWIEEAADGHEAEHPAPTLKLAAATIGDEHGAAQQAGNPAPAGDPHTEAAASSSGSNTTATVALIVGAFGLLAGLGGLGIALSNRRSTSA